MAESAANSSQNTAESPLILTVATAKRSRPVISEKFLANRFVINSSNAAEMARKSHASRRAKLEALRIAAMDNQATKQPSPQPTEPTYQEKRLARVRKQLDKVDLMMMEELDPQKLDRLASASARLSEIERQLAGRPMPGSLKPVQERPKRSPTIPLEPQEEPSTPLPVAYPDQPQA